MTITKLVCTTLMIAAVVYDVIALSLGGVDASISHWCASFSAYPVPVFGCGFLAGHFFGSMKPLMPIAKKAQLQNLATAMRKSSSELDAWAARLDDILDSAI